MDGSCFITGKGKCVYWASWDAVFTMSATWLVYNDQEALEGKCVHRA